MSWHVKIWAVGTLLFWLASAYVSGLRIAWLLWLPNSQWHRVITGELCRVQRLGGDS